MNFRIMMKGDDGTLWCEVNHKSLTWCEEHGAELCDKYEGATWFIEKEETFYQAFSVFCSNIVRHITAFEGWTDFITRQVCHLNDSLR